VRPCFEKITVKCPSCNVDKVVRRFSYNRFLRGLSSGLCKRCASLNCKDYVVKGFERNHIPWNKGIKGFRCGKRTPHTEEARKKISNAMKGRVGDKASNWQGGRTKEQKRRMLGDYQSWRRTILVRDEFKCTKCNEKNIKLHVHHNVIPFSECNGTGLEIDIDNGITLCKKCHKEAHNGVQV